VTDQTDPNAAIEVWARLLCAADVHVHGEDHPTWKQLVGEPGSRIRDDYRKAAAWLLPRLTVPAVQAPATDRAALRARLVSALDTAFQTFVSPLSDAGEGLELSEHLADAVLAVLAATTDRATVETATPVKQRADCSELEWAEQERARFERLYTRETVRADIAEQRADTAARDADIYQKRLERLSEGYTEQRKRAEAMERAMESTAADALKHRGCHRDLMAQCLRAERAEAEVERLRTDQAAVLREAADIAEAQRQFEPAFGARKSAQVSENVGILRVAEELRRMAAEAGPADAGQVGEAHPPTTTWKVESPRRDNWASWGATYDDPDWARERYESATSTAPARPFRLVRATTTYTVEAEHAPADDQPAVGAQQPKEA
jgi:hypothetical protein